jgi:hypothetical protein
MPNIGSIGAAILSLSVGEGPAYDRRCHATLANSHAQGFE